MMRVFVLFAVFLGLAGCAADPVWAPDEAVRRVQYSHPGPPRLTLFTMISNDTGSGGHTSLMINGSERIIFDPSGSFKHPSIPERNDVLFGITPKVADVYTRYHARKTWHVVVQELDVTPQAAELAIKLAKQNGAVMSAYCAHSTSGILRQLPGFEHIRQGFYPVKLMQQFDQLPGVRKRVLHEYDDDDNSRILKEWNPDTYKKK